MPTVRTFIGITSTNDSARARRDVEAALQLLQSELASSGSTPASFDEQSLAADDSSTHQSRRVAEHFDVSQPWDSILQTARTFAQHGWARINAVSSDATETNARGVADKLDGVARGVGAGMVEALLIAFGTVAGALKLLVDSPLLSAFINSYIKKPN